MATDLLERRSSIYSNRVRMPIINELMGWDFVVTWMPYGARRHRRLLHQELNATNATHFHPYELKATYGLLRALLDTPDDLESDLRQMAAGCLSPASNVKLALDMINTPYEAVKCNIENGGTNPSFMSRSLQNMDESCDMELQEYIIKSTAGTMYAAGSDTTVSAIVSCILGLIENPAVLKKAQEELDRVIDPNQLPTFDDEGLLAIYYCGYKRDLEMEKRRPNRCTAHSRCRRRIHGIQVSKGFIFNPHPVQFT
ncbi:O-methylsterigmatocystin oxidoreductase [Termitomyces sp. J132]|nr:O-methylsterigmatocystin oxidoreductase [Termitomyces sp. J132]